MDTKFADAKIKAFEISITGDVVELYKVYRNDKSNCSHITDKLRDFENSEFLKTPVLISVREALLDSHGFSMEAVKEMIKVAYAVCELYNFSMDDYIRIAPAHNLHPDNAELEIATKNEYGGGYRIIRKK